MLALRRLSPSLSRAARPAASRLLAAGAPAPAPADDEDERRPETLEEQNAWKPKAARAAMAAGGLGSVYLISSSMINMASWFMNIAPHDIGLIGFSAGFLSAGLCGAGAYGVSTLFGVRPEPTFRQALKLIKSSHQVREEMGKVKPGQLRAYHMRPGRLGLEGKALVWNPARVQMLFALQGSKEKGLASVEAVNRRGRLEMQLVAVDVIGASGGSDETLLVAGYEDRLHVADQLRGFMLWSHMDEHKQQGCVKALHPDD